MRTKTIEVNLEDAIVESLYLANLEKQAEWVAGDIRSAVASLATENERYQWEDLFNHIRTFNALREALDYNKIPSEPSFFPFGEEPKKKTKKKGKKK